MDRPYQPAGASPLESASEAMIASGPLLIGDSALPGCIRTSGFSGTKGVAASELSLLKEDVVSGATDKLRAKKSIHKRVFTSVRDGYLRLSSGRYLAGRSTPADTTAHDARHDRLGYFLDPWNNPYWIQFNKKTGKGALYSFGPNRRRDVSIRNASRPASS